MPGAVCGELSVSYLDILFSPALIVESSALIATKQAKNSLKFSMYLQLVFKLFY